MGIDGVLVLALQHSDAGNGDRAVIILVSGVGVGLVWGSGIGGKGNHAVERCLDMAIQELLMGTASWLLQQASHKTILG